MIILSHRGYWKTPEEKNQKIAFTRSFSMGFGTETDLRDRDGRLVISHDMAGSQAMPAEEFLDIYKSHDDNLPLALNIKADGLQAELQKLLNRYGIKNYFVFDMAVPDGLIYARQGFNTFTRQSEYEPVPSFYALAQGVWLDEFNGHWLSEDTIRSHLSQHKAVCIVSPDLHRRAHETAWEHYRKIETSLRRDNLLGHDKIMLCTDFPEQARDFFNDQN